MDTLITTERIAIAPKVKMLTSLRYSGYNNNSAIGDIVDNSIDAGAKNIYIDINSKNTIRISDDASGMSESRLVEAMTMGSETDKNSGTTLGRFGFGMKTASLSLGRSLTVITKTIDGEIVTAVHDLDTMNEAQQIFVDVHRGAAQEQYHSSFVNHTRKSNKGTVVVIDKIDQLSNPNIPAYRGVLKTYIAEVFRNFIKDGTTNIYLNGSKIEAVDISLEKQGGEVYSDRNYLLPYLDENGKQKSTTVRVRLFLLPDLSKTKNKELGINQFNQGLYVMRNNRQIIRANMQWLGLVKNSWYNRFRGEIYLGGELDKTVGIDYQKMETANTHKSFETRIQAIIKPGFDAIQSIIRNQMMDALVEDEAREDQYRKIEEDINAHYDEVKKYKPEADKTNVTEPLEDEKQPKPEKEETPLPTPRKPKNKRLIETCNARLGVDGVICDYEFKPDGVLRLTWNVDHKFYADFLANRDYETVGAMVKLFAATARTQARLLMNTDEERAKIEEYNQFISDEVGLFMSEPRRKKGDNSPQVIETEHDSITFLSETE